MRRSAPLLALLLLIFAGCGGTSAPAATATPAASPTPPATATPAPTATTPPTATPKPTATPQPTATPKPTATAIPTPNTSEMFALNNVASQEQGGIKIEIARVFVSTKDAAKQPFEKMGHLFDDKKTIVQLAIRVTNTTDKSLTVYVDQGQVIVGSEQIDIFDYAMVGAKAGDDLGGEIFPGVTKLGFIMVGLKRSSVADVQSLSLAVKAPHDKAFKSYGDDFLIAADLSKYEFQPLPDEMK